MWSVDVAPLHGSIGVSIRCGSDFVAINRLENVRWRRDQKSHGELVNNIEQLTLNKQLTSTD